MARRRSWTKEENEILVKTYKHGDTRYRGRRAQKNLENAGYYRTIPAIYSQAKVLNVARREYRGGTVAERENKKVLEGLQKKSISDLIFNIGDSIEVRRNRDYIDGIEQFRASYFNARGKVIQETPYLLIVATKNGWNQCINKIDIALREVNIRLLKKATSTHSSPFQN